jgi:hypothetical protein
LTIRMMRSGTFRFGAAFLWIAAAAYAAGWQIESVEPPGVIVKYTSLKVDTFGNVHVAYAIDDNNHYPLRYAFWDHTTQRWFKMTVDQNIGTCSLTLDSKQHPHISYTDFAGGRLKYAHWDGAKWNVEVVPINAENIDYYQSIALTPDDHPNISFYEYRGPKDSGLRIRLRVVMWNGKYWELRTVDSDQGSGKFNAMAADSQGHLHLAFANVSAGTGGMRYAFWDGHQWTVTILEGEKENHGHGVGWSCNIAVDKQGTPHMTYVDEVENLVKYAVLRDGQWQIHVIGRVLSVAFPDRNSIAIADDGRPYVGFYDAGQGILAVAHPEGQKWVTETVDGGGVGYTSSMQIYKGTIWISYADVANGGLKVARRQLEPTATTGPSAVAAPREAKN